MANERYHPALITLHWLIAFMLVVAITIGMTVLEDTPNSSPEKIGALKGHMIGGILILVLTIVRLVVKVTTSNPAPVKTGNPFLAKLGVGIHHGFYFFIIAMAGSGLATAIAAGLPDIVFGGSGAPLPKDFSQFAARGVHGLIADILVVMVILHIAGALVHQFKLKDNLMARMKFGKK
ncbi:MAG: cytochrome b/b6 domain-containing protein [Gammaproteobacteria bacterium]|nr:cytochrome b/b6 domain-containing protein [Gammaproteobacteria bacterium]